MTLRSTTIAAGLALAAVVPAYAGTVMVGGALAVVKAAYLVEQAGPSTASAPAHAAFATFPAVPGRHDMTNLADAQAGREQAGREQAGRDLAPPKPVAGKSSGVARIGHRFESAEPTNAKQSNAMIGAALLP